MQKRNRLVYIMKGLGYGHVAINLGPFPGTIMVRINGNAYVCQNDNRVPTGSIGVSAFDAQSNGWDEGNSITIEFPGT